MSSASGDGFPGATDSYSDHLCISDQFRNLNIFGSVASSGFGCQLLVGSNLCVAKWRGWDQW